MARILVIDDSPSAVQKARTVLEEAGHVVESLDLLIYLPQAVKDHPPDLILLDLSMPALSGVNVAKFIRRYQSRPIPLVLYSSRSTNELEQTARELEATGFVNKAEPDHVLLGAIAQALPGRRRAGV